MTFQSITDKLDQCSQAAFQGYKTRADNLYAQLDAAGSQAKPAVAELNAAHDAAITEIKACLTQAQQALGSELTSELDALPDTDPSKAQETERLRANAGVAGKALESTATARIDDVDGVRARTARKLTFKITAVRWRRGQGAVVLALLFIVMAFASFYLPATWGAIIWLINLALLIGALGVIGILVTGVWWGFLVDTRNMISLSRLQLATWTIVILSAFLTVALTNVAWIVFKRPDPLVDPLGIAIPQELWALMGISTASFAGSTLIKSNKASDVPVTDVDTTGKQNLDNQRPAPGTTVQQGKLVGNESIVDASAADTFRGEEVGNADEVDLGKVQMFAFTFIVVIAYGFALSSMFQGGVGRITQFPDLSQSMITLLGISHAGYLTVKAASHSGAQPEADPSSAA